MRGVAAVALAVILLFLDVLPGQAERRVALVIGNSAYRNTPGLANPLNDAEDIANALRAVGFNVLLERDLDKHGMDGAVSSFARRAQDADAALVFYAGHGIQHHGLNYLVPIDAKLEDEISINFELTRIDDVLFGLERARGVKILILDACRSNPLLDRLTRLSATRDVVVTRGLARVDSTRGMVVAYATQPNQVAVDGTGRNSPFTAALVRQISEPGLEIGTLFRRVAAEVDRATGGRQLPELSISLRGEFYLNARETDVQAWTRVQASNDPAELKGFITQYPASVLAPVVRQRLAAIERERSERLSREQERLSRERAEREAAERERAAREEAARAEAARVRLAMEQTAREKAEREEAEREKVALERLAKLAEERARREQTEQLTAPAPPTPKDNLALLTPASVPAPVLTPKAVSGSSLIIEIKKELKRVGCYAGSLDDAWGSGEMKSSVRKFVRYANLPAAPDEPAIDFLDAIRDKSQRVCPLDCGQREVEKDGRCIAKTCPSGSTLGADGVCQKRKTNTATLTPESNHPAPQRQPPPENGPHPGSGASGRDGCPAGLVRRNQRNGGFRCLVPMNSEVLRKEPDEKTLRRGQVVLVDDGSCPKGQLKRVQAPSSYLRGPTASYCAPR